MDKQLRFDDLIFEWNYGSFEGSKTMKEPIVIVDESEAAAYITLTLDEAKWIRDNIGFVINKLERMNLHGE